MTAFHSFALLLVTCGDSSKVANEIGMTTENSVVLFHRLRKALNVRREELQTLSQPLVFFG